MTEFTSKENTEHPTVLSDEDLAMAAGGLAGGNTRKIVCCKKCDFTEVIHTYGEFVSPFDVIARYEPYINGTARCPKCRGYDFYFKNISE